MLEPEADRILDLIRKRQHEIANIIAPHSYDGVQIWTGTLYAKAVVEHLCGEGSDE